MSKKENMDVDFDYSKFVAVGVPSIDVGYIAVSGDLDKGIGVEGHVGFSSEFLSSNLTTQVGVLKDWIDIMKGQLERTKDDLISELYAKARK